MLLSFIIRLVVVICEIFAILVILLANNICVFTVHGRSMEPGFCNGDKVIALNTSLKIPIIEHFISFPNFLTKYFLPLSRGSLVLIHGSDDEYILKRIIGLPGDSVSYQHNYVSVNGKSTFFEKTVNDQLYIEGNCVNKYLVMNDNYSIQDESVFVPINNIYCLGDNRIVSVDSRTMGTYDISAVQYVALFKLVATSSNVPLINYCFWFYTWFIKFI